MPTAKSRTPSAATPNRQVGLRPYGPVGRLCGRGWPHGRWRQAINAISVIGCPGTKITSANPAPVLVPHAVDNGWIRLQAHPLLQAAAMNVHDRLLADYFRWVDHVGLQQAIELPGERFTLASVHRANGKRRKKGWFTSKGASSAKNGGGGVATAMTQHLNYICLKNEHFLSFFVLLQILF